MIKINASPRLLREVEKILGTKQDEATVTVGQSHLEGEPGSLLRLASWIEDQPLFLPAGTGKSSFYGTALRSARDARVKWADSIREAVTKAAGPVDNLVRYL